MNWLLIVGMGVLSGFVVVIHVGMHTILSSPSVKLNKREVIVAIIFMVLSWLALVVISAVIFREIIKSI